MKNVTFVHTILENTNPNQKIALKFLKQGFISNPRNKL